MIPQAIKTISGDKILLLLILGLIFCTSTCLQQYGNNGKLNMSISVAEFPIIEAFLLRFF